MAQEKVSSLQDMYDKASMASEKQDQAFMKWSIAWESYASLKKKNIKTPIDKEIISKAYDQMCLTWEIYTKVTEEAALIYCEVQEAAVDTYLDD